MLHNCVSHGSQLAIFSLEAQDSSQEMDASQRCSPILKSEALHHTEVRLPQAIPFDHWQQPDEHLMLLMPDEIFEKKNIGQFQGYKQPGMSTEVQKCPF